MSDTQSDDQTLDPELILKAYCLGVFPMAMGGGEIGWFSPDPRGVIPLDGFHIPHGLRRFLKKNPEAFEIRVDTAFGQVMEGCADRAETWINPKILKAYQEVHERGFAHSLECWQDGELVGGLYGVHIGGAFFGESMFSRVPEASKVALVALVKMMREQGFRLLDTQWTTGHLDRFGCVEIPRDRYLRLLEDAVSQVDVEFVDPEPGGLLSAFVD